MDPVRDLEIIHRELLLKDIAALRTYITKNARNVGRNLGGKTAKAEFMVCVKALNWVLHGEFTGSADEWAAGLMDVSKKVAAAAAEEGEDAAEAEEAEAKPLGRDIRAAPWAAEDIDTVNKFQLLTAKPMVYLINLSMKQYTSQKCKWIAPVKEFIKARGCGEKLVPFSAAFEQKVVELGATAERDAWIKEVGVKTMIPKIIKAGYKALHLVHFFTCGADEVKAWTVRAHSTAPKAAGVIHTDFEKGFICAEVQKYSDLHERESRCSWLCPQHKLQPALRSDHGPPVAPTPCGLLKRCALFRSQLVPRRQSSLRASSALRARHTWWRMLTSCSSR